MSEPIRVTLTQELKDGKVIKVLNFPAGVDLAELRRSGEKVRVVVVKEPAK